MNPRFRLTNSKPSRLALIVEKRRHTLKNDAMVMVVAHCVAKEGQRVYVRETKWWSQNKIKKRGKLHRET